MQNYTSDTMMKEFLSFVFAFGFQITTGTLTVVQTCPETKSEWEKRSSMFTCVPEDTKYHCVMDSSWNLVEGCISPLNITGNNKGCPSVFIFESTAYWMFPFTSCSTENHDCPQEDHGGYSSEELFKYPACFLNASERTWGNTAVSATTSSTAIITKVSTSSVHLDKFYRSDVAYVHFVISAVFFLIVMLFIFTFELNRRIRNRIEKAVSQDVSRVNSQSSVFAVNISTENGYSSLPSSVLTYQTSAPSKDDGGLSTQRKFVENGKSSLPSSASIYKTSTTSNDNGGFSTQRKFVENRKSSLPSSVSIHKTSTTSKDDGGFSTQPKFVENGKSSLPRSASIYKTSTTSKDDGGFSTQPKFVENGKSSLPRSASIYKTSTTSNDNGGFSVQRKYVGSKNENGKVFAVRNIRKGRKRQSRESDSSFA